MVLVLNIIRTEIFMKENGRMIRHMEPENYLKHLIILQKKQIGTPENYKIGIIMVKVSLNFLNHNNLNQEAGQVL